MKNILNIIFVLFLITIISIGCNESKSEAKQEMKNIMNNEFCKTHKFELQEMFNNLVISFYKEDVRPDCCGNGCCM